VRLPARKIPATAIWTLAKKGGTIWNYHGNQRLTEERKKAEGRRKKHTGSTRLLILICIIAIGFHEWRFFSDFFIF
jgi:hypothetical protein